ncbi:MAG: hypothetical protein CMI53_00570 [Parcubacteria group bacterium]|jgi:dephospho-CoA kinase|nr:hypothetical protein [Parcubacteria group bacterium]|tara:strand:- start:22961 stop:23524 length:564 start_codon:yes stop_codon:yes gene_type:complete
MGKVILGLVGELAAGKGTIVDYLKKKHQAVSFRYSDPLRETLELYDVEITRDNMQSLSTFLRQNYSESILADSILKKIKSSDHHLIVIDGVRRFTDFENLTKLPNFHLVYVTAEPKTRYDRYIKRDENVGDNTFSFEDFSEKEKAEADKQVPAVGKKADFKIDNNGDFESLHQQVEDIWKKIDEGKN